MAEGFKNDQAVVWFVTVAETGEIYRCDFIPNTYTYVDTPERLQRIKDRLTEAQIPWRTGDVSFKSDMVEFGRPQQ